MIGLAGLLRGSGADLPFAVPGRDHGAGMEGYYWRVVTGERVLAVLCGICRGPKGRWALVALAEHPSGAVRQGFADSAAGASASFGARAGELLSGSAHELRVRFDEHNWLELSLTPRLVWPRRAFGALGIAHALPGLAQYWQPLLLDGSASGVGVIGGEPLKLDDAHVYAEKNWGPGFAGRWWWGQAGAFAEPGLGVAFAGGCLPWLGVSPTAAVVWHRGRVLRFAPPFARPRVAVGAQGWRLRIRSAHHRLEIEGEAAGSRPHRLPVPEPGAPRWVERSEQLLAGRLRLRLTRGGRPVINSTSPLAGLELGHDPLDPLPPPPEEQQP